MFGGNFNPTQAFQDARQDFQNERQRYIDDRNYQTNREDIERQQQRNAELQREFAQHGIQWKVEDAKRAGLHPLYALGGAGATFSPAIGIAGAPSGPSTSSSSGFIDGQDVSRAAEATMTEAQYSEHRARMEVMRAQVDETDARTMAIWSEEARKSQSGLQASRMPPAVVVDQFAPRNVSKVQVKPDEVVSTRAGDVSLRAGQHAADQEYALTPYGLKIRLPASEEGISEALENIPFWMWPGVIMRNISYYGPQWGQRFFKEWLQDEAPKFRSSGVRGGSMALPRRSPFIGRSSGR